LFEGSALTGSPDSLPQYAGKDLEAMSFALNYHRWIMAEFRPFLGKQVAEVGAGTGSFSGLILENQIENLTAFEPSQNLYPSLCASLSHDQRATAINDYFGKAADGQFDSVLYVNVLEHIQDDRAELAAAYKALSPGGYLLIFVPALPRLYSELDKQLGHFRRYVKKDLEVLVLHAGFTLTKVQYFDIAGIVPWYVNFVMLKNSMGSGSVSLYDRLVVPPMRILENLLAPPIGKNLLLVARKPDQQRA